MIVEAIDEAAEHVGPRTLLMIPQSYWDELPKRVTNGLAESDPHGFWGVCNIEELLKMKVRDVLACARRHELLRSVSMGNAPMDAKTGGASDHKELKWSDVFQLRLSLSFIDVDLKLLGRKLLGYFRSRPCIIPDFWDGGRESGSHRMPDPDLTMSRRSAHLPRGSARRG
jgi:hypothetical protein